MTKTKRVRIAVAVDADGGWVCVPMERREGLATARHRMNGWHLLDRIGEGSRFSFIEADVPLPEEPATVRWEVVDG